MFGRLLKVSIYNSAGNTLVLVDTKTKKYQDYICKGVIERFPGSQMDCLTLTVYNLDPVIRGEIGVLTYTNVKVEFGYEDEGGILTTIFDGKIIRPQHTRDDVVTDASVIYAYDSGNFKTYGFFSRAYADGTNYYDIAEDILNRGNIKISYALSEKLKQFTVKGSKTLYGKQDELLQNIAKETGLTYKTENNVARIFGNNDKLEEIIVFSRDVEGIGNISESGLIGIPTLTSDGLDMRCLVNPKIKIYSMIKVANSMISNEQSGAIPNVEAGGQLSKNGLYKVIKLTINFSNNGEQNYMSIKAVANDIYGEFVKNG